MAADGGHEVEQFVDGAPVLDRFSVEGGGRDPGRVFVVDQVQFGQGLDVVERVEFCVGVVLEVFLDLDQVYFQFLVCFLY